MDIIKKLQLKFIIAVVLVLTTIFFLILLGINKFNSYQTEYLNQMFLKELIIHDGVMPKHKQFLGLEFSSRIDENPTENVKPIKNRRMFVEPFDNVRNYFSVKITHDGELISIISDFPLHYTDIEIGKLVNVVFSSKNFNSTYEGIRYMIEEKPYGFLAVFTETRVESNMQIRLIKISSIIFIISLIISIFIAWIISIWAIKPVRNSFEKQRRFISDASHELKTPLSVISANMDVLVSEVGENKWSDYIQLEINKMRSLIKDLLYLAKSDDKKNTIQMVSFDLSRSLLSLVLPFEAKIFESGKKLEINIQEDVMYTGIQQKIEQLVTILLDNAEKYAYEKGIIKLSLKTSGNKKIISVYNSGEGIPKDKQKLIFERFYRLDDSRSRETGGYGLGLAIAQEIVNLHKGKIHINSEVGKYTEFSVIL